jgi:hypothetical protein
MLIFADARVPTAEIYAAMKMGLPDVVAAN